MFVLAIVALFAVISVFNIGNFGDLIGAALLSAAVKPNPLNPKGNIDNPPDTVSDSACDYFGGWAWDPDFPNKVVGVRLLTGGRSGTKNGIRLATAQANILRNDLVGIKGNGRHGFNIKISATNMKKIKKGKNDFHLEATDLNNGKLYLVDVKTLNCL